MKTKKAKKIAASLPTLARAPKIAEGSSSNPVPPSLSHAKKRLFQWGALILVPFIFLVLAEAGLRLMGFGYRTSFFLPARRDGQPVLIENQKFGWRFFTPEAARTPKPMVLSPIKPANTLRLFVFGESAAYGDPDPAFGFPRILEMLLRQQFPERKFEVVNVAMTAINSHVIREIARDCRSLQGDFWLIYMGNNEVVGPYGAGTVFGPQVPPLSLIRASLAVKNTRLGQLEDRLQQRLAGRGKNSRAWGGMEMFMDQQVRQDDPRMPRVYAHFEQNLRDIIQLGRQAGAQVLVSTAASNLKDCPPFASLHRLGLTAKEQEVWDTNYLSAMAAESSGNFNEAMPFFREAARIDEQYAELQFRWGRACWETGSNDEARQHFILARDYDALRFRADTRLNEIIRSSVTSTTNAQVELVDFVQSLSRQSERGITGGQYFWEHVHFLFDGNYRLARAFAESMARHPSIKSGQDNQRAKIWLTAGECAQRLALTDFNRYEMALMMRQRLELPPFAQQLDHTNRIQKIQQLVNAYQPALAAAGLKTALAQCQKALTESPEDWVLLENYAQLLKRGGDMQLALEQWRKLAARMPHHRDAWFQTGTLLDQMGRSADAMEPLQKALALKPDSAEVLNSLGLAMANQGKNNEAIVYYEKAVRLKSDFPASHVNWGVALARLGRTNEAKAHYQTALKLKPNYPGAYLNLGMLLTSEGQVSAAISNYTAVLKLNPDDAMAHFQLGSSYKAAGNMPAAISHYSEALRINPAFAEARLKLGLEWARQGRESDAMKEFTEAVRIDPDLADARLNLGVALAKQQQFEQAAEHFREVLRIRPQDEVARKYLDMALSRTRKSK